MQNALKKIIEKITQQREIFVIWAIFDAHVGTDIQHFSFSDIHAHHYRFLEKCFFLILLIFRELDHRKRAQKK
jgi:hypothetical protein